MLDHLSELIGWPVEYSSVRSFEWRPVGERHRLLAMVVWLLQDWPDRLVSLARELKIRQALIVGGIRLPYWFESEVRASLGAGFRTTTPEEATNVAAYLQNRSEEISIAAIGRVVGCWDVKAVRPFAKRPPQPLAEREFWEMIERLTARIRDASDRGSQWATLWRDRTMLIVQRLSDLPAGKLRRLTVATGFALTRDQHIREDRRRTMAGHLLSFVRLARPILMAGKEGEWLFPVGASGKPMTDGAWRDRLRRSLPGQL